MQRTHPNLGGSAATRDCTLSTVVAYQFGHSAIGKLEVS